MTNTIEDTAIQTAYTSIHNFFDAYNLEHALKYSESILQAAVGGKVWKKESPSGLLLFMENFRSLYAAAFSINYNYSKRTGAVIVPPQDGVPDISVTKDFMDERMYQSSVWSKFPATLQHPNTTILIRQ